MDIKKWPHEIIHGVGGFHDFEKYEIAVFTDRDVSIVSFVLRALGNPRCEGSKGVLAAILEHRATIESEE